MPCNWSVQRLINRLRLLSSVSYTHLDVYKRQVLHWPFPAIILAAGFLGHLAQRYYPKQFNFNSAHAASAKQYGAAVIDDDTPAPAHALFNWAKFWRWLSIGMGIWLAAMGLLILTQGWQATLTQMGWFFSKAALLTFGGAYAVLPYVFQGAVEHYHWLTAHQMMDGLALGETTPGPLIMVCLLYTSIINETFARSDFQTKKMFKLYASVPSLFTT